MPLVLMCGLPSSGKSRRVNELKSFFVENHSTVSMQVIDEDTIGPGPLNRNVIFKDSQREKEVRGQLRSEVQKRLTKDDVVILDAANYIKGYRYELYCMSKANKTTCCVIHCDTAINRAWEWNEARPIECRYDRDVFDAMCQRFEPPDARNRWDSPLFTIQADDHIPSEAIYDAVCLRKAPPAHQSTQSQPLLSTNFLYDLDRITQEIVRAVLEAQKVNLPGDEISVLDSQVKLKLNHLYTGMELARLRRQFIVYIKMHPVENCQKLSNMFVQYLSSGVLQ